MGELVKFVRKPISMLWKPAKHIHASWRLRTKQQIINISKGIDFELIRLRKLAKSKYYNTFKKQKG